MGAHINKDGRFQSDKYVGCPPGKVPLSTRDKSAQDLLWKYAGRRRKIDAEFADDLETCLRADGYEPGPEVSEQDMDLAIARRKVREQLESGDNLRALADALLGYYELREGVAE